MSDDAGKQHNLLAYIIVLLLGGTAGGGVSLLSPAPDTETLETRIIVLEARVDMIAELEMRRMGFR